jgi:hypothetical protein
MWKRKTIFNQIALGIDLIQDLMTLNNFLVVSFTVKLSLYRKSASMPIHEKTNDATKLNRTNISVLFAL